MKTRNVRIQLLEDTVRNHVHPDHFAVKINKLPSFNGIQLTDVECLSMLTLLTGGSTLYTEDTWDHSVGGAREFGLSKSAAGKITIYSSGADRPTTVVTGVAAADYWSAFNRAAKLWKSFQEKIAEMINKIGGEAKVNPADSKGYAMR